jgi:His/Glu/Gln/Arg/opine family amino acid ABC transporter permease subunit
MFANFDFDVIGRSLGYLFFDGMTFTLTLTGLSALGGLIFGTLIALMRLSGLKLLGHVAGLYVDLMRSLPLVLVIFWFYFLVPYIGQWLTGSSRPIHVGAFASSLITFIMFEAAYFSEIMRAGIQSISRGQPAADHALCRAAAGIPEHAAGAADADDRAVPGHFTGLRGVDYRLSGRRQQSRAARRTAGRNVPLRSRGLLCNFLYRVIRRPAPAIPHRLRALARPI